MSENSLKEISKYSVPCRPPSATSHSSVLTGIQAGHCVIQSWVVKCQMSWACTQCSNAQKLSNMTATAMTITYFECFAWNPPVFHSIPLWQTHSHSLGFWQPPTPSDILTGWSCLSDWQPWTISSHQLTQTPRSIHTNCFGIHSTPMLPQ